MDWKVTEKRCDSTIRAHGAMQAIFLAALMLGGVSSQAMKSSDNAPGLQSNQNISKAEQEADEYARHNSDSNEEQESVRVVGTGSGGQPTSSAEGQPVSVQTIRFSSNPAGAMRYTQGSGPSKGEQRSTLPVFTFSSPEARQETPSRVPQQLNSYNQQDAQQTAPQKSYHAGAGIDTVASSKKSIDSQRFGDSKFAPLQALQSPSKAMQHSTNSNSIPTGQASVLGKASPESITSYKPPTQMRENKPTVSNTNSQNSQLGSASTSVVDSPSSSESNPVERHASPHSDTSERSTSDSSINLSVPSGRPESSGQHTLIQNESTENANQQKPNLTDSIKNVKGDVFRGEAQTGNDADDQTSNRFPTLISSREQSDTISSAGGFTADRSADTSNSTSPNVLDVKNSTQPRSDGSLLPMDVEPLPRELLNRPTEPTSKSPSVSQPRVGTTSTGARMLVFPPDPDQNSDRISMDSYRAITAPTRSSLENPIDKYGERVPQTPSDEALSDRNPGNGFRVLSPRPPQNANHQSRERGPFINVPDNFNSGSTTFSTALNFIPSARSAPPFIKMDQPDSYMSIFPDTNSQFPGLQFLGESFSPGSFQFDGTIGLWSSSIPILFGGKTLLMNSTGQPSDPSSQNVSPNFPGFFVGSSFMPYKTTGQPGGKTDTFSSSSASGEDRPQGVPITISSGRSAPNTPALQDNFHPSTHSGSIFLSPTLKNPSNDTADKLFLFPVSIRFSIPPGLTFIGKIKYPTSDNGLGQPLSVYFNLIPGLNQQISPQDLRPDAKISSLLTANAMIPFDATRALDMLKYLSPNNPKDSVAPLLFDPAMNPFGNGNPNYWNPNVINPLQGLNGDTPFGNWPLGKIPPGIVYRNPNYGNPNPFYDYRNYDLTNHIPKSDVTFESLDSIRPRNPTSPGSREIPVKPATGSQAFESTPQPNPTVPGMQIKNDIYPNYGNVIYKNPDTGKQKYPNPSESNPNYEGLYPENPSFTGKSNSFPLFGQKLVTPNTPNTPLEDSKTMDLVNYVNPTNGSPNDRYQKDDNSKFEYAPLPGSPERSEAPTAVPGTAEMNNSGIPISVSLTESHPNHKILYPGNPSFAGTSESFPVPNQAMPSSRNIPKRPLSATEILDIKNYAYPTDGSPNNRYPNYENPKYPDATSPGSPQNSERTVTASGAPDMKNYVIPDNENPNHENKNYGHAPFPGSLPNSEIPLTVHGTPDMPNYDITNNGNPNIRYPNDRNPNFAYASLPDFPKDSEKTITAPVTSEMRDYVTPVNGNPSEGSPKDEILYPGKPSFSGTFDSFPLPDQTIPSSRNIPYRPLSASEKSDIKNYAYPNNGSPSDRYSNYRNPNIGYVYLPGSPKEPVITFTSPGTPDMKSYVIPGNWKPSDGNPNYRILYPGNPDFPGTSDRLLQPDQTMPGSRSTPEIPITVPLTVNKKNDAYPNNGFSNNQYPNDENPKFPGTSDVENNANTLNEHIDIMYPNYILVNPNYGYAPSPNSLNSTERSINGTGSPSPDNPNHGYPHQRPKDSNATATFVTNPIGNVIYRNPGHGNPNFEYPRYGYPWNPDENDRRDGNLVYREPDSRNVIYTNPTNSNPAYGNPSVHGNTNGIPMQETTNTGSRKNPERPMTDIMSKLNSPNDGNVIYRVPSKELDTGNPSYENPDNQRYYYPKHPLNIGTSSKVMMQETAPGMADLLYGNNPNYGNIIHRNADSENPKYGSPEYPSGTSSTIPGSRKNPGMPTTGTTGPDVIPKANNQDSGYLIQSDPDARNSNYKSPDHPSYDYPKNPSASGRVSNLVVEDTANPGTRNTPTDKQTQPDSSKIVTTGQDNSPMANNPYSGNLIDRKPGARNPNYENPENPRYDYQENPSSSATLTTLPYNTPRNIAEGRVFNFDIPGLLYGNNPNYANIIYRKTDPKNPIYENPRYENPGYPTISGTSRNVVMQEPRKNPEITGMVINDFNSNHGVPNNGNLVITNPNYRNPNNGNPNSMIPNYISPKNTSVYETLNGALAHEPHMSGYTKTPERPATASGTPDIPNETIPRDGKPEYPNPDSSSNFDRLNMSPESHRTVPSSRQIPQLPSETPFENNNYGSEKPLTVLLTKPMPATPDGMLNNDYPNYDNPKGGNTRYGHLNTGEAEKLPTFGRPGTNTQRSSIIFGSMDLPIRPKAYSQPTSATEKLGSAFDSPERPSIPGSQGNVLLLTSDYPAYRNFHNIPTKLLKDQDLSSNQNPSNYYELPSSATEAPQEQRRGNESPSQRATPGLSPSYRNQYPAQPDEETPSSPSHDPTPSNIMGGSSIIDGSNPNNRSVPHPNQSADQRNLTFTETNPYTPSGIQDTSTTKYQQYQPLPAKYQPMENSRETYGGDVLSKTIDQPGQNPSTRPQESSTIPGSFQYLNQLGDANSGTTLPQQDDADKPYGTRYISKQYTQKLPIQNPSDLESKERVEFNSPDGGITFYQTPPRQRADLPGTIQYYSTKTPLDQTPGERPASDPRYGGQRFIINKLLGTLGVPGMSGTSIIQSPGSGSVQNQPGSIQPSQIMGERSQFYQDEVIPTDDQQSPSPLYLSQQLIHNLPNQTQPNKVNAPSDQPLLISGEKIDSLVGAKNVFPGSVRAESFGSGPEERIDVNSPDSENKPIQTGYVKYYHPSTSNQVPEDGGQTYNINKQTGTVDTPGTQRMSGASIIQTPAMRTVSQGYTIDGGLVNRQNYVIPYENSEAAEVLGGLGLDGQKMGTDDPSGLLGSSLSKSRVAYKIIPGPPMFGSTSGSNAGKPITYNGTVPQTSNIITPSVEVINAALPQQAGARYAIAHALSSVPIPSSVVHHQYITQPISSQVRYSAIPAAFRQVTQSGRTSGDMMKSMIPIIASLPKGMKAGVTRGKYSYTGPDGKVVTTNWYVDETGFHIEGDENAETRPREPKTQMEKGNRSL